MVSVHLLLKHRMIPNAVGQPSMADVWPHDNYEVKYRAVYQEFSPINHLDANDPPLYLENNRSMKLPAASDGDAIHHPMFGVCQYSNAFWRLSHGFFRA